MFWPTPFEAHLFLFVVRSSIHFALKKYPLPSGDLFHSVSLTFHYAAPFFFGVGGATAMP
jgi:hypothetical protein